MGHNARMADPTDWFLTKDERTNTSSAIRSYTEGNLVKAHVHGRSYFRRLCQTIGDLGPGDRLWLAAFRVDGDELLDGPGSSVSEVVAAAATRGVDLRGLVWRSQPGKLEQSEEENADFVRTVQDAGGDILLDPRTRRGGSHHQKLIVTQQPRTPERDVAFLGGIDLARSRGDDADHAGDPQPMDFPEVY